MSADVDAEIVAYLRRRRRRGNCYVTARQAAAAIDESLHVVSHRLPDLEQEGLLDRWNGDTTGATVYRIAFEPGDVDADADAPEVSRE